jgi:MraZ protein
MTFHGTFDYTIDDNNRLNIPAKFRKTMKELNQTSFIASREDKHYIKLFPIETWQERVGQKIRELPHSDPRANRIRRIIGQSTTEVTLDSQGRINIPGEYYEHAEIERKVRIIGSVDTLQLWNPDRHTETSSQDPLEDSALEELQAFNI